MDTYTSVTYKIQKHNDDVVKKIEYNSCITDTDKQISTYYTSIIEKDKQNESFTKLLRDKSHIYQQLGNSINKADWMIQEYENNNLQKEYNDMYEKHNFDSCLLEYMPSINQATEKYLIANQ